MQHLLLLVLLLGIQAVAQEKALLDLALEPPAINTKPGPEYDDAVRPGNMIIGLDRTPKGRLWAAWVGNGDSPNGFFMLSSSDDGGKSWSKPRVVIDPADGNFESNGSQIAYTRRALVGNLWTDPLGRLWCFSDQSLGYFDGRCGDWYIRCDDPDAAEPVWTKPVRFADGCTLNKPTVLGNGDWLIPVSLWTRDRISGPGTSKEAHHDLDAIRMANVFASTDHGKTWTPLERFDVGFPREGATIGQGPTELMILGQRSTLFFSTHAKHWNTQWRSWFLTSDDSFKTWSKPQEVPGRLKERTFIRKHIVCKDGRIMIPFQHYVGPDDEQDRAPLDRAFTNPRNGVLISSDGGRTWSEHGNIRLTPNDRYFGWAENDLFEHPDGRITMVIRADGLGGLLFKAESRDGGKTWPEFASTTPIPNPGSKTTLYNLGGDRVAILHNPNSKHRSPMALWISFDGMKTWPYQRVLQQESVDGPKGRMNYPDGFVSADGEWLHFAFDDNRHRAVHYSVKLPPLP